MILGGVEMHRECALTKFSKQRDAALVMLGVCTGDGEIARGAPFSRAHVQYCTCCMRVTEYGVQVLMYR